MADHKKTFFGKISHEEKLQYLIDLTKLGNKKINFLTILYNYLTQSSNIADHSLLLIYDFLQKLFDLQKSNNQGSSAKLICKFRTVNLK